MQHLEDLIGIALRDGKTVTRIEQQDGKFFAWAEDAQHSGYHIVAVTARALIAGVLSRAPVGATSPWPWRQRVKHVHFAA